MNREYVMLATAHKDLDNIPKDMLWSIKYDGMRSFWVPTTRGLRVQQVPFCDDPIPDQICTGLFSRYGKVLHAPDVFLDRLPEYPLDGELWTGRNDFQRLVSICRGHNSDWTLVAYMVFDSPRYLDLFTDGRINNNIVKEKLIVAADNAHLRGNDFCSGSEPFLEMYRRLDKATCWNGTVRLATQFELDSVRTELDREVALGGEGLIGRGINSRWVPKRTKSVIKLKPTQDDECVIVDHLPGEGKHHGRLGSYTVIWKGKRFNLSGMNDYDREHPLAKGTMITFRYKTLTADGFPREARFVREFTWL